MNYNSEYPKERGYWYDVQVKKITVNRRNREVIGNVTLGSNKAVLNDCRLMFLDDILKIKPHKLVAERTEEDDAIMQTKPSVESKNTNLNQIFSLKNYKINLFS
jgi:E3 ubiquitin-protein ligase UHRF1